MADLRARPLARPVGFREVFAITEFRALYAAHLLSLLGDKLAAVALAMLVYGRTGSAVLAALTFGVEYLPYLLGGPTLSVLADRYSRRRVLIVCDAARAPLVGLLALPGMPTPVMLGLLLAAAVFGPPFAAARSALVPDVLEGERYAVGLSAITAADQLGQVLGYAIGGAVVATLSAPGALLADAATFGVSALLVVAFVRSRPMPAGAPAGGALLADALAGVRLVLGHRQLRTVAGLAWLLLLFAVAPEGLAAPYARHLHGGSGAAGLYLAAGPAGFAIGALVVGRLRPAQRDRWTGPLTRLACAALIPALADPPFPVLLALLAGSGFGMAANVSLNRLFVDLTPAQLRARAFGTAAAGVMAVQGVGTLVAGGLAQVAPVPYVVGGCGAVGLAAVWLVGRRLDRIAGGAPSTERGTGRGGRHRARGRQDR